MALEKLDTEPLLQPQNAATKSGLRDMKLAGRPRIALATSNRQESDNVPVFDCHFCRSLSCRKSGCFLVAVEWPDEERFRYPVQRVLRSRQVTAYPLAPWIQSCRLRTRLRELAPIGRPQSVVWLLPDQQHSTHRPLARDGFAGRDSRDTVPLTGGPPLRSICASVHFGRRMSCLRVDELLEGKCVTTNWKCAERFNHRSSDLPIGGSPHRWSQAKGASLAGSIRRSVGLRRQQWGRVSATRPAG